MNLKNMRRSEDTEQIHVVEWAARAACRYPELKWCCYPFFLTHNYHGCLSQN
jgi:hypothetical protein